MIAVFDVKVGFPLFESPPPATAVVLDRVMQQLSDLPRQQSKRRVVPFIRCTNVISPATRFVAKGRP